MTVAPKLTNIEIGKISLAPEFSDIWRRNSGSGPISVNDHGCRRFGATPGHVTAGHPCRVEGRSVIITKYAPDAELADKATGPGEPQHLRDRGLELVVADLARRQSPAL
ncbi:hypothetical protein ACQEVF_49920 [Nonomuraea polychroma]|uniref:hypothetical protein n=1 Tax=Nonomuraea polychroma TaxID=46176 RepID=UPI003D89B12A